MLHAAFDGGRDAFADLFGRERPKIGRLVEWITNFERAHRSHKSFGKFVVNWVEDEKPLGRDAGLSGVHGACFYGGCDRRFEIGAFGDNERIVPA